MIIIITPIPAITRNKKNKIFFKATSPAALEQVNSIIKPMIGAGGMCTCRRCFGDSAIEEKCSFILRKIYDGKSAV